MSSHHRGVRGEYWLIPFAAFIFWTATLLGLLLWWAVGDDAIQYKIDESTVVFISDVGAAHKQLFIPGTALTWIFYANALIAERWLRHLRRIPGPLATRERNIDIAAVVCGVCGGACLLLLSIFNAFEYSTPHWILTACFVVLIAISAALQTTEVIWLEKDHPGRKHLRRNAIIKLFIVSIAIAIAIVFAVTYLICDRRGDRKNDMLTPRCNRITSAAGVAEWTIAFIYDGYLLTLCLDLWPARKTEGHHFTSELVEADRANILHEHKDGRPGAKGIENALGSLPQHPPPSASASTAVNMMRSSTSKSFKSVERSSSKLEKTRPLSEDSQLSSSAA